MHLYAFGSICRGEVSFASDVDLLALVDGVDDRFDPMVYSIYSYDRLRQLWAQGSPFAWHLWQESRFLHGDDGQDWLRGLGAPAPYPDSAEHCLRFASMFSSAAKALAGDCPSPVFELSTVFLAMRNFATCYSLGFLSTADFSRRSPLKIGTTSIGLPEEEFGILERARLLCTRGFGPALTGEEVSRARAVLPTVQAWLFNLLGRAGIHE
ncbi:hypothetical protein KR767_18645 [Luteibacter anthropi]|uniref:hypothetical protein n=1 Tax=Luteibacter anthropi TaxID=564369 RepID=UPI002032ADCF|nr:hypothetical protein [Luteibacter anthropi]URX62040.1 hypothetical protein KR767_18645 [Luteibacter anthropi]